MITAENLTTATPRPTAILTADVPTGVPALELINVRKAFTRSEGRVSKLRRKLGRTDETEAAVASEGQAPVTGQNGAEAASVAKNGAGSGGRASGDQTVVAVDNVSLRIERGEIFGVLGPNGTGKSTLVRLISTLLVPDAGTITVFGHDVEREELVVKRLINRVSVDAAFFKKLSAMENLMYAARLYGVSTDVARDRAIEILKQLGLEEKSVWSPMEDMSRGMQQKVAIARAFLTSPVLLLLDEPTTGLDPRSKREVQAFVREIQDVHEATVLLTTHDMAEAEVLCQRIAVIDKGRIVALDTPEGLKALVAKNGHTPTLEDVFLELTGRGLNEEEV